MGPIGPGSREQAAADLTFVYGLSGPRTRTLVLQKHARKIMLQSSSWRGVRAVEGARLESVCTSKAYPGFESLSLRHIYLFSPSRREGGIGK